MVILEYLPDGMQGIGRIVLVSHYYLQYGPLDKSGRIIYVGSFSIPILSSERLNFRCDTVAS